MTLRYVAQSYEGLCILIIQYRQSDTRAHPDNAIQSGLNVHERSGFSCRC